MPHLRATSAIAQASAKALAEELQFVQQYENRDNTGSGGWYIIDSEWMQRWAKYAKSGGPKPGLISNGKLLDPSKPGYTLRAQLRAGQDYKALCEEVWIFLQQRHGGGPQIYSRFTNVYAGHVDIRLESIRMSAGPPPEKMAWRDSGRHSETDGVSSAHTTSTQTTSTTTSTSASSQQSTLSMSRRVQKSISAMFKLVTQHQPSSKHHKRASALATWTDSKQLSNSEDGGERWPELHQVVALERRRRITT
mmetsp:Transcript_19018/g.34368  ORF Transcript_19018/g.34368 Transcript_19018/m.34368 type:complete len:250 (-) Transcript_19018:179-928(-)